MEIVWKHLSKILVVTVKRCFSVVMVNGLSSIALQKSLNDKTSLLLYFQMCIHTGISKIK